MVGKLQDEKRLRGTHATEGSITINMSQETAHCLISLATPPHQKKTILIARWIASNINRKPYRKPQTSRFFIMNRPLSKNGQSISPKNRWIDSIVSPYNIGNLRRPHFLIINRPLSIFPNKSARNTPDPRGSLRSCANSSRSKVISSSAAEVFSNSEPRWGKKIGVITQ